MRSALIASYNTCGDLSVAGQTAGAWRHHNVKKTPHTLITRSVVTFGMREQGGPRRLLPRFKMERRGA